MYARICMRRAFEGVRGVQYTYVEEECFHS